jgi:hypothetical protein
MFSRPLGDSPVFRAERRLASILDELDEKSRKPGGARKPEVFPLHSFPVRSY